MLEVVLRECGSANFYLGWGRWEFHVRSLLAYIAYTWGTNGLTAGTIAGYLAAIKFFRRQERGLELFSRHPWIVDALKEVPRSHTEAGTKSRIRRIVAWSVPLAGESCVISGDPGACIVARGFVFLFSTGRRKVREQGRMLGQLAQITPWARGFVLEQYPTRLDSVGSG